MVAVFILIQTLEYPSAMKATKKTMLDSNVACNSALIISLSSVLDWD